MIITKCAKRLMATVMTTALVLTGLVVAPKEVSAAEGDPTVSVKGATLRLDNNLDGTQSMRVGIEVKNASQAKECGITIKIGDKQKEISTANESYQNIYDYNEATDTVIYTVVVKEIPSDNFKDSLSFEGNAVTSKGENCTPIHTVNLESDLTSNKFVWGADCGVLSLIDTSTASYQDNKISVNGSLAYNTGAKSAGQYYVVAEVSGTVGSTISISYMNRGAQLASTKADGNTQVLEGLVSFTDLSYPAFSISGTDAFDILSLKILKVMSSSDLKDNMKTTLAEADVTDVNAYSRIISCPITTKDLGTKKLSDFEKVIIDYSTNNPTANLKIAVEKNGAAFATYNNTGSNKIEISFANAGLDPYGTYKDTLDDALAIPVNEAIVNIVPQVSGFSGKVTINSITLVEKSA